MPTHLPVVSLLAWWLGLLPVVLVVSLRAPRAYWWLALALSLSWVADATALLTHAPFWVSRVYPVSQAVLVGAVFLSRKDAGVMLGALVGAGLAGVFLEPPGPELFIHLVAWLTAATIAAEMAPLPLARALMVYFGVGALCWTAYVFAPGWMTWGLYQATRAIGIGLFGMVCWRPSPRLQLT